MNKQVSIHENSTVDSVNENLRVIITGGGTGGHIFPALAIANALKVERPGIEILFVGAKGKMEMEKIPEAGYEIEGLDIVGYDRSSLIKNIFLPFKVLHSFLQVKSILKKVKPHAVIGVGGYSTYPVLRLAQFKNIPTFILESNSLAGKSNQLLAARAKKVFVASQGMEKYFPANKIMFTGNPVRSVFTKEIAKEDALQFFGLTPHMKTVFVMGGSQGAKSINETIGANIEIFKKNNLQLIWQTGKSFAPQAAREEEERNNIWTNAFINNMENAYAAADVIVSRAGAMTIAEIAVVKKAVIFVPFPFAAENHQVANAKELVEKNAALMVMNDDAKTELIPQLLELVKDDTKIRELEKNLTGIGNPNADRVIAIEVLKSLNK